MVLHQYPPVVARGTAAKKYIFILYFCLLYVSLLVAKSSARNFTDKTLHPISAHDWLMSLQVTFPEWFWLANQISYSGMMGSDNRPNDAELFRCLCRLGNFIEMNRPPPWTLGASESRQPTTVSSDSTHSACVRIGDGRRWEAKVRHQAAEC